MMWFNHRQAELLVPLLISTLVFLAHAQNYVNTGLCSQKSDGSYLNPGNCHSFYICQNQGSQTAQCPQGTVFSGDLKRCDSNAECRTNLDLEDRMLSKSDVGQPNFCAGKSEGFHKDNVNCDKFYRCINQFTYRFTCPNGLYYNHEKETCDWPRNVQCDGIVQPVTGSPINPWSPQPWRPQTWRPQPVTTGAPVNPWTQQPWTPQPWRPQTLRPQTWGPQRVTTRAPVNPWTQQPWTPQPWRLQTLRPQTWGPQRVTTRAPVNPWTQQPWTPQPWRPQTLRPQTWGPQRVTTRAPVNPWTQQPWTPQPWRPQPVTARPWRPQPVTTRSPINPWITSRPVPDQNGFGGCNRVVCYFVNWAQYRSGSAKQTPADIDASLCTHIIFAFAKLTGNKLYAYEWNDESTQWMTGNYEQFLKLKQKNPTVKLLLAVGGWNLGSDSFSKMVSTAQNRQEFITTTVAFLRKRRFDGIDVDWEYPAKRGGSPAVDRHNHAALLTEMRAAFDQEGAQPGKETLLMTAAVSAGKDKIDDSYDVPTLNRMLDFINLMAYDLHGTWESKTGHNSPLFSGRSDTGDDRYLNVDWATRYWIQKGASPSKLVLGLPLYGRSFRISGFNSNVGIGAPATGAGRAGTYTKEAGYLAYYEICRKINNSGRVTRMEDQRVPYMVDGNDWIGYDDVESLTEKVKYSKQMNLGGVMVWDLSMDDFNGAFCNQGKWPLMKAITNQCRAP